MCSLRIRNTSWKIKVSFPHRKTPSSPAVGSKIDSKDSWIAACNDAIAVLGTYHLAQGSLYDQPQTMQYNKGNPENYHRFVMFDSPAKWEINNDPLYHPPLRWWPCKLSLRFKSPGQKNIPQINLKNQYGPSHKGVLQRKVGKSS